MLHWPPYSSSMNCSGYYRQEYLKEYSKGFQTKKEKEIEKKNSY